MAGNKITQVMMDDQTIDASKEIAMVLSIANTLRGPYRAERYKDVIIPMIILRRLECALDVKDTKGKTSREKVLAELKKNPKAPDQVLIKKSGYPFYNKCEFTLANLLTEAPAIVDNLTFYIESFSANVQSIFEELKFKEEIKTLDKHNRLLGVIKKFSELDLNPETVDNVKMGYMFEDIIRRYSENADAGDHYTPREVIRLLTSILLAEGCNDVFLEGKEITVLDMACGSGGMLSCCHDFIMRMNPDAKVRLFGQENNPESHAICLADMLIKNQAAENICFADTMKIDCFENTSMRFVIANPPFGQPWGGKDAGDGVEKAVRDEHKKKNGRFPAGLPATGDMQLLFMQHAVSKLKKGVGRAAIITNGSPLFSGNTTSGESQIRRWLLENDYVEAIIGLPSQLFYNTDIAIYAFIISKNKAQERKNKVQLINATDVWTPIKRSLGKKRREIDRNQMRLITETYSDFMEGPRTQWNEKRKHNCKIESRIFDREEFLYKEWAVYQPLQRRGVINAESIEKLRTSTFFTANSNIFSEGAFEELEQTNPRDGKAEKQYQKMLRGREFTVAVIQELKKHESDEVFMDYDKFEKRLKSILSDVDGYSSSRLTGIAMAMSVIDKTAVVQKDRKGNILIDSTTKDTEIIRLNQDVKAYMDAEVYPHIPDAIYRYEYDPKKADSSTNKEKLGAEFPFTRYFYEYHEPESADALLAQFMELEKSLTEKIAALQKGAE
jgi:type I restriction enzyme M protein